MNKLTELPENFYISYTERDAHPELWAKFIGWLNRKLKSWHKSDPTNYIYKIILNSSYGLSREINSYYWSGEYNQYYGIIKDSPYASENASDYGWEEISILDWDTIVNKRSGYYLRRGELIKAYNSFNCSTWREVIETILRNNPMCTDDMLISIPISVINRAAKECTTEQKAFIKRLGIELIDDKSVNVDRIGLVGNTFIRPLILSSIKHTTMARYKIRAEFEIEIKSDLPPIDALKEFGDKGRYNFISSDNNLVEGASLVHTVITTPPQKIESNEKAI